MGADDGGGRAGGGGEMPQRCGAADCADREGWRGAGGGGGGHHGWYWAVDALQAAGASVHVAHPLGVKGFAYRRVKNDLRDAAYLADLLGTGRLPEAWIAPPRVRERPSPTSRA